MVVRWQVHFNTCAVVANGGILLNALEGGEIDAHEAVSEED